MSALDDLDAATRRYNDTADEHEKARIAAIDAAMAALRAGERPTDVEAHSPFTAAYIRRHAREAGIEPSPRGPKSSKE